jgi:hypothetical protein
VEEERMMRPPIGVAILGFFALVNGVAVAIIGLQLMGAVAFGPAQTGSGLFFWGLLALGLGVLYIALAYGAWTLQLWAWTFGMLLAVLGIFQAVMVLIATNNLGYGVAAALLPAVILWYLNTEGIKDAFVKSEQGRGGYISDYDREQAERMMAERQDDSMNQ